MGVQNSQWHFFIGLPEGIDHQTRLEIAEAAINHIIDRTKNKKNIWNRRFIKYTKQYAKRKGVGRTSVDLTFDDKMLNAMKLIQERRSKLKIGYRKNSKENAKCEGNMLGTYGKPSPVTSPRKFLGMTQKEIVALVKRFAPEYTNQEIIGAQTDTTIATA